MDYGVFNVRIDVNACECAQGCMHTVKRVCTENWLWEGKIPCRPGESNLRQPHAGSTLHQLSYIPGAPSDAQSCIFDSLPSSLSCAWSLPSKFASEGCVYSLKLCSMHQLEKVGMFLCLIYYNQEFGMHKFTIDRQKYHHPQWLWLW